MVESNVDLTDNVEFEENQLLEYVVNVLGRAQIPDLFFQGNVLSLDNSNNAPPLPSSNRLSLSSPSSSIPSHLDLLDLSYPLTLSSNILSYLPSPSPFLPPSLPDVPRIVDPNIEDVDVGIVRVHFNLGSSGDFTFDSANVVVTEFDNTIRDTTISDTDIGNRNANVDGLVNGNVYDFTIRTTYTDSQGVVFEQESANVSHELPTLPDRWFISNVHDTGSGNVRVEFEVRGNNDFQFASANIVVQESDLLVHNAEIATEDITQGNVDVTGLAESNVYDFTIETFFDQPFGYSNVSDAYNK